MLVCYCVTEGLLPHKVCPDVAVSAHTGMSYATELSTVWSKQQNWRFAQTTSGSAAIQDTEDEATDSSRKSGTLKESRSRAVTASTASGGGFCSIHAFVS